MVFRYVEVKLSISEKVCCRHSTEACKGMKPKKKNNNKAYKNSWDGEIHVPS